MKRNIQAEINKLSIFDTNFRKNIRSKNVFGLGESNYSPATDTATVKIADSDIGGSILKFGEVTIPYLSTTYTHEMAHSVFTRYTNAGNALNSVIQIKNALIFLILNKMLDYHGRVWRPITRYSDECRNPSAKIIKMLGNFERIAHVENTFFEGWKIGQEVVAFGVQLGIIGNTSKFSADFFGVDNRSTLLKSMEIMAKFNDDQTVFNVVQKLDRFLNEQNTSIHDLSFEELQSLAKDSEKIFENDKDGQKLFISWLSIVPQVRHNRDENQKIDQNAKEKIVTDLKNELTEMYESSAIEHIEAIKLFSQVNEDSEIFQIVAQYMAIAVLFTPKLPAKNILSIPSDQIHLTSLDEAASALIKKLSDLREQYGFENVSDMLNSFFNEKDLSCTIIDALKQLQKNIGWTFIDDRQIKSGSILGTSEWINKLIHYISNSSKDRKFLNSYFNSSRTPKDIQQDLELEKLSELFLLFPHQIAFRIAFTFYKFFTKKTAKDNPEMANVFPILEELNIISARDFVRVLKRFASYVYSLFREINGDDESNPLQVSTIYTDQGGIKLLIPSSAELFLEHNHRVYIMDKIANIFTTNGSNETIFCPIGQLLSFITNQESVNHLAQEPKRNKKIYSDWNCDVNGDCTIKNFLKIFKTCSTLLCAKNDCVEFYRCFNDNLLTFAGRFPFELIVLSSKTNDYEIKTNNDINLVNSFRDIFNPKQRSGKVTETESKLSENENKKKESKESNPFIKTRKEEIKKLNEKLYNHEISKANYIFQRIILDMVIAIMWGITQLIFLPFRFTWIIIKYLYKLSIQPQKLGGKLKRSMKKNNYYNDCDFVSNNLSVTMSRIFENGRKV